MATSNDIEVFEDLLFGAPTIESGVISDYDNARRGRNKVTLQADDRIIFGSTFNPKWNVVSVMKAGLWNQVKLRARTSLQGLTRSARRRMPKDLARVRRCDNSPEGPTVTRLLMLHGTKKVSKLLKSNETL